MARSLRTLERAARVLAALVAAATAVPTLLFFTFGFEHGTPKAGEWLKDRENLGRLGAHGERSRPRRD